MTNTWPEFARVLCKALRSICPAGHCCAIQCRGMSLDPAELTVKHRPSCVAAAPSFDLCQIRLFAAGRDVDSLTVCHDLAARPDEILKFIEAVSFSRAFTQYGATGEESTESQAELQTRPRENEFRDFPAWFLEGQPCNIFGWIAAYLEYIITVRYLETQTVPGDFLMRTQVDCLIQHLERTRYWNSLQKPLRTEVLLSFISSLRSHSSSPDRLSPPKTSPVPPPSV